MPIRLRVMGKKMIMLGIISSVISDYIIDHMYGSKDKGDFPWDKYEIIQATIGWLSALLFLITMFVPIIVAFILGNPSKFSLITDNTDFLITLFFTGFLITIRMDLVRHGIIKNLRNKCSKEFKKLKN